MHFVNLMTTKFSLKKLMQKFIGWISDCVELSRGTSFITILVEIGTHGLLSRKPVPRISLNEKRALGFSGCFIW